MKEAILTGQKTATTRYRPLGVGEKYQAVSGPPFKAEPFAVVEIQDRIPSTWKTVVEMFYKEEGFDSPEKMSKFLWERKLIYSLDDAVFFHRFKVIELSIPSLG